MFEVIAGMDITDAYGVERLYSGELLTDWKLLCSTCCYLTVDGVQYRLTEFGENFQVGSYRRVLGEEETLEVEFRVRLNAESPWIVQTVEFTVYPYKLYVQGWEAGSYLATYYPEEDEAVDLNGHRDALFPEEVILGSLFDAVPLEEYFEGWADAADGSPVISQYEPAAKGLSIVRPLPFRPVPAGYEVQYSWGSQDLAGAPEDATVLDIPQGIDAVSIYDFDEPLEFDEVIVPESVQKLDLYSSYGTSVRTAYRVDERNRAYFSRDGMLFDAWEGALIGIPTEKAVVDVPAGTPSVALPQQNNIAELRLNSEQPPELDLGALDGAVIVVPDEHYVNYLKAWGSDFQGNSLITASGDAPDVYVRDGALLTRGRGRLGGARAGARGGGGNLRGARGRERGRIRRGERLPPLGSARHALDRARARGGKPRGRPGARARAVPGREAPGRGGRRLRRGRRDGVRRPDRFRGVC